MTQATIDLPGTRALVTGSSKGIGLGIARFFDLCGARTLYHGRESKGRPNGVEEERYLMADLFEAGGPAELVEDAFAREPELDTLVANAGGYFDKPFLEMDAADFHKTMRLNLEATFEACQAFARRRTATGKPGSIVIISSTNSFQAEDESVAYDTSKGGLYMMTRSLAVSLAPHKIRVNGVAPGLIRTPLTETTLVKNPDVVAHYNRKILLQRIGEPEDCAGACAFLASSLANYITGHVIVVDGGLTVGQIGRMEP